MPGSGKRILTNASIMSIKFFLLVFSLFSVLTCFSQEKETPNQEKHNPGLFWYVHGWKHKKNNHRPKYDRLVFDLTYNDFSGDVAPLSQGFNSIGIIMNQATFNLSNLEEFTKGVQDLRAKGSWSKDEIVNLYFNVLPDFAHKETGTYLDQRM